MNRQWLVTVFLFMVSGLITACSAGGSEKTVPISTPSTQPEAPIQVEPQSKLLELRLTSPDINMVTELSQVTVAGMVSPGATLSVNGHLVSPNTEGLFSIDLDFSDSSIPMVIEVIASSITGETKSEVRPVISSDESSRSGLFGSISSVTPSNVTIDTGSNTVSLSVDSGTLITMHGWKSPSISNLTTGTLVGVLKQGSHAKSILAVPIRPVLTRHFTGIVTDLKTSSPLTPGKITLLDSSKRQITALTIDEIAEDTIGSLVTAVLEQDFASGDLKATVIDPALNSAKRILAAIEMNQKVSSRQATENVTALRWRLVEHGVRNLSILLDQQPHEDWKDTVTSAEEIYTQMYSKHYIGSPSAEVTGLITSISKSLGSNSTKLITVHPASGQPVTVKISENTPVALSDKRVKSRELDLASRVTVRYSTKGNDAHKVTVMAGNTLSLESSTRLAAIADEGEVYGLLIGVIDSELVVSILMDQEKDRQISLRSDEAIVFRNGMPIKLDSSLEGSKVFAWFDPSTYQLIEMESLDLAIDEYLVSGVIHSFSPKFANGNFTMRTIEGQMRTFTHDSDTAIRRDGRRVSIHYVRPGDLVRPNTKIRTSNGTAKIVSLSLKTPEPVRTSGFIRGVMPGPDGQVQVTVSNIWLDLITLEVNHNTRITQPGHTVGIQDLKAGQEVDLATYNPVTLEMTSLALNPPIKSGRASR